MHLFSKAIDQINYDDVAAFVRLELTEWTRHDYKREFPPAGEALAATIASLANTMGGVVLLGVEQPKVGAPTIVGVEGPQAKLKERVGQIVLRHIYPTPIIEVGCVEIPEGLSGAGRFVVIVRMHESRSAPHVMVDSGAIYVRTGDLKTPYKYADLHWLEHLLRRRDEPEALRQKLVAEFAAQFTKRVATHGVQRNVRLESVVARTYPFAMLMTERQVASIVETYWGAGVIPCPGGGIWHAFRGNGPNTGSLEFVRAHAFGILFRGRTVPLNHALTFDALGTFIASSYRAAVQVLADMGWQGTATWTVSVRLSETKVLNDLQGPGPAVEGVDGTEDELLIATAAEPAAVPKVRETVNGIIWGLGKQPPAGNDDWLARQITIPPEAIMPRLRQDWPAEGW